MARSVNTIYQAMLTTKDNTPSLSKLSNNSFTSIWRQIFYICAIAINLYEQINDSFNTEVNTTLSNNIYGSIYDLNALLFLFQYNENNPQSVQITQNLGLVTASYNPINQAYRIISLASITAGNNRTYSINVASGSYPYSVLTAGQLTALQDYINKVFPLDSNIYTALSVAGDILLLGENTAGQTPSKITYNSYITNQQFIQSSVITAINTYLQSISANLTNGQTGTFNVYNFYEVLNNIRGVTSVFINNLSIKTSNNSTPVQIIVSGVVQKTNFTLYSGWCIIDPAGSFTNNLTISSN